MARPVNVDEPHKFLKIEAEFAVKNCWFVWTAAGNRPLKRFVQITPYRLPWLAWHRRDRLKIYKTDAVERKILYGI